MGAAEAGVASEGLVAAARADPVRTAAIRLEMHGETDGCNTTEISR